MGPETKGAAACIRQCNTPLHTPLSAVHTSSGEVSCPNAFLLPPGPYWCFLSCLILQTVPWSSDCLLISCSHVFYFFSFPPGFHFTLSCKYHTSRYCFHSLLLFIPCFHLPNPPFLRGFSAIGVFYVLLSQMFFLDTVPLLVLLIQSVLTVCHSHQFIQTTCRSSKGLILMPVILSVHSSSLSRLQYIPQVCHASGLFRQACHASSPFPKPVAHLVNSPSLSRHQSIPQACHGYSPFLKPVTLSVHSTNLLLFLLSISQACHLFSPFLQPIPPQVYSSSLLKAATLSVHLYMYIYMYIYSCCSSFGPFSVPVSVSFHSSSLSSSRPQSIPQACRHCFLSTFYVFSHCQSSADRLIMMSVTLFLSSIPSASLSSF